jgi:hypothetical protein
VNALDSLGQSGIFNFLSNTNAAAIEGIEFLIQSLLEELLLSL